MRTGLDMAKEQADHIRFAVSWPAGRPQGRVNVKEAQASVRKLQWSLEGFRYLLDAAETRTRILAQWDED